MKKRFSSIVKEYHFDSVQSFYKELNAAKRENQAKRAGSKDKRSGQGASGKAER